MVSDPSLLQPPHGPTPPWLESPSAKIGAHQSGQAPALLRPALLRSSGTCCPRDLMKAQLQKLLRMLLPKVPKSLSNYLTTKMGHEVCFCQRFVSATGSTDPCSPPRLHSLRGQRSRLILQDSCSALRLHDVQTPKQRSLKTPMAQNLRRCCQPLQPWQGKAQGKKISQRLPYHEGQPIEVTTPACSRNAQEARNVSPTW